MENHYLAVLRVLFFLIVRSLALNTLRALGKWQVQHGFWLLESL